MPEENSNVQDTAPSSDPRIDALMAQMEEIRRVNSQLVQQLATKPEPREEPLPQVTGTEFLDNPVNHINTIVERRINKLNEDLSKQLEPFANYMVVQQKERMANVFISEMEGNANYPHISNPFVRRIVTEGILSAPNPTPQYVHATYLTAVGLAYTQGKLESSGNKSAEPKTPTPNVPAHIRPSGSSGGDAGKSVGFIFDENERTIMRQRKWSDARAAYAFGRITAEEYLKLEPNGKILEGL